MMCLNKLRYILDQVELVSHLKNWSIKMPNQLETPSNKIAADRIMIATQKDSNGASRTLPVSTSVLVILLVAAVNTLIAGLVAVVFGETMAAILVCTIVLPSSVILFPYAGLAFQLEDEYDWFKVYVLSLKRVPGLDIFFDSILEHKEENKEDS